MMRSWTTTLHGDTQQNILSYMRGYYGRFTAAFTGAANTNHLLRTADIAVGVNIGKTTALVNLVALWRRRKIKRVRIGGRGSRYYGWKL